MTQDRIVKIVARIFELILEADSDETFDAVALDDLVRSGYTVEEIKKAMELMDRLREKYLTAAERIEVARTGGTPIPRQLARHESMRMTEEALDLFYEWQRLGVMTFDESEEILRQVVCSDRNEVGAEDLRAFAAASSAAGSALGLYISSPTGGLQ